MTRVTGMFLGGPWDGKTTHLPYPYEHIYVPQTDVGALGVTLQEELPPTDIRWDRIIYYLASVVTIGRDERLAIYYVE